MEVGTSDELNDDVARDIAKDIQNKVIEKGEYIFENHFICKRNKQEVRFFEEYMRRSNTEVFQEISSILSCHVLSCCARSQEIVHMGGMSFSTSTIHNNTELPQPKFLSLVQI